MNQQTILKNLEIADKIIDEACNTGYTLQDSDVRILKSIFGIIKEETEDKNPSWELNITHCPDCKYCVKTKDGEYNPDDIVCSYWSSDGLESGDFCSYGEKGEYEWCDYKDLQGVGFWQNDKVAFHKTCPFCGCHIRDDKRDVFEGDGEYNFCINCGARLKEGEK